MTQSSLFRVGDKVKLRYPHQSKNCCGFPTPFRFRVTGEKVYRVREVWLPGDSISTIKLDGKLESFRPRDFVCVERGENWKLPKRNKTGQFVAKRRVFRVG